MTVDRYESLTHDVRCKTIWTTVRNERASMAHTNKLPRSVEKITQYLQNTVRHRKPHECFQTCQYDIIKNVLSFLRSAVDNLWSQEVKDMFPMQQHSCAQLHKKNFCVHLETNTHEGFLSTRKKVSANKKITLINNNN